MSPATRALLPAPLLLLVVGLVVALLPTTQGRFASTTGVSGSVASAALVDRLAVERLDPAVAATATAATTSYVEQVRPLGGGLVSGLPAARADGDGDAAATVAETGSDRLRVPTNGSLDVDAAGWTPGLTGGTADRAPSGGRSGTGALRFTATGSAAGPVSPSVTWSTSFAHTGGARAVALHHDVRLSASVGLVPGAVLSADLVAPGGAVTRLIRSPLAPGPVADGSSPWRTATGSASGTVVDRAGTYVLRLTAELPLTSGSDRRAVVLVDDVALDVTGLVLGPEPANRAFDRNDQTRGWEWTSTTGDLSTAAAGSWSFSDGEVRREGDLIGAMRVSITGTLAATGTVTWSTPFGHVGGSAGRTTLGLSHRILLGNRVSEQTGYSVLLQKPSGAVVDVMPFHRVVPGPYPGLDPGWTRRSVTLPDGALDETGTYRLSVHTNVDTVGGDTNAVGLTIGYDNIELDRVATGRHLDVEAVVPGTFRSAARLEWRAATSGDPVAVTLWRDGAWRDVGTVTSTGLTTSQVALTHRADAAEAAVRVRFTSQKDASTDDVLRLDWLKVVPLDPPLLSGDTDLTLPAVATGGTAPRLTVVRLRNRSGSPVDLTLAADAPVLAWAGFEVASAAGGTTCTPGWTDGVALSTRCTLPPGGSVSVDLRVVGGRVPGSWTAALVLADAARPGYFRAVVPARVTVTG